MRQLLFVIVLVAAATTAHAENRAKAREAFRLGRQHYALREYKEALVSFQEAYRNYEDPSFLFNIAQCERQLEHRAEAIRAYRMYLVNAPNSNNRDEVRDIITRLEREVDAEQRAKEAQAQPQPQPQPQPVEPTKPDLATPAAAASTSAAAPLTLTTTPTRAERPTYKKWWVWTLVGVAVAGGAAAGLAIGLTRNNGSSPTAMTSFGTASPF